MTMRVKARVLLELGSELISSDPIALYELIKNSLDAEAKRVDVVVAIVMGRSEYLRARTEIQATPNASIADLRSRLLARVDSGSPEELKEAFIAKVLAAKPQDRLAALHDAYVSGSTIEINDDGSGMSRRDLDELYLTVGTPNRLLQKRAALREHAEEAAPLGEKGIGRLSTMRLGNLLRVTTTCAGEPKWHELEANWGALSNQPELDLEDFPVEVADGDGKPDPRVHATRIRISDLQSDWRKEKLEQLAHTDFAKLIDPFRYGIPRPDIRFQFNNEAVTVPTFESRNLTYAHATCTARFYYDEAKAPVLEGMVQYRSYSRSKPFKLSGVHLFSALARRVGTKRSPRTQATVSPVVASGIDTLGPFEMEAHWFNRQKLQREKPDGFDGVLRWLRTWGGGLMLFRNHFRVYPYAELNDDWLDLDGTALGSGGYKLNRKQIVGAVRISSNANPCLQDQTNREGLRDCNEKEALVTALRYIMFTEFKVFLNSVEGEVQESSEREFAKLDARVDDAQRAVIQRVKHLRKVVPPEEVTTLNQLLDRIQDLVMAWDAAKQTIANKESEIENYLYLAGVGLMTEFIFHELTRLTGATLDTLKRTKGIGKENPQLSILRSQLTTLEKRIRILDPMATPGRQRRGTFDVAGLTQEGFEGHEEQFRRHRITVISETKRRPFEVHAVKGQLIQILENLISNSVYWLEQEAAVREFEPVIELELDPVAREIRFRDNGPGIPIERETDVFTAFFTTKPPGVGRGLGLYIAKKLAEYNGLAIELETAGSDRCHHGFVIRFEHGDKAK